MKARTASLNLKDYAHIFYSAIAHTTDAVFITDSKGRIQYANPAFEKLTGYKRKEAIGKTPSIIKSGLQSNAHYKKLWTTILSGNVFRSIVVNRKKNGELFYADHTITPIKDKNGKVTNFVGIWKDITDHMLHEKRKDEFISIASHELKTPLTSINIFIRLLKSNLANKDHKKTEYFLQKIDSQIKGFTKLISNVMDVNMIRAGKMTFHKKRFYLDELIEQVAVDMEYRESQHAIVRKGIIKQKIYGDKERIAQVLTNLINNAAKYSPNANKIIIRASKKENNALIEVQDFGIGIPQNEQKYLFQPFYRANNQQVKKINGLGMGLYIAKEIIASHKGKLWIKSTPGKGSTFTFTLPIKNSIKSK